MARVHFELPFTFDAPPEQVWNELIDWKAHEKWIPATEILVHSPGDATGLGAELTAWTGLGRKLALEDRMRVDELAYDEALQTGSCTVTKLGPVLRGTAGFTVTPTPDGAGTEMAWIEAVTVPYAPQFLAPIIAFLSKAGFKFGLSRLAKQLR